MVVRHALECPATWLAAGRDIGDQIENFIARQLVKQPLGHHRRRRPLALDDVTAPDHRWCRAGQRILNDFDGFRRLFDHQAGDDFARP